MLKLDHVIRVEYYLLFRLKRSSRNHKLIAGYITRVKDFSPNKLSSIWHLTLD